MFFLRSEHSKMIRIGCKISFTKYFYPIPFYNMKIKKNHWNWFESITHKVFLWTLVAAQPPYLYILYFIYFIFYSQSIPLDPSSRPAPLLLVFDPTARISALTVPLDENENRNTKIQNTSTNTNTCFFLEWFKHTNFDQFLHLFMFMFKFSVILYVKNRFTHCIGYNPEYHLVSPQK